MKQPSLLAALLCCSLSCSATPSLVFAPISSPPNTIVKQFSNEAELFANPHFERSRDVPTHIVRMSAKVDKAQDLLCDDVVDEISSYFVEEINHHLFTYNIIVFCTFDAETELATHFAIQSYFDPLSDKGIAYLEDFMQRKNEQLLLGSLFKVEQAKGMVIALNIDAGIKENRDIPVLVRYQHDNNNHYFASNYVMSKQLIEDIKKRFYSHEAEVILPFLAQWIGPTIKGLYNNILQRVDYVELQPERIFLMDEAPYAFTSSLRYYFAHSCKNYDNKRCL